MKNSKYANITPNMFLNFERRFDFTFGVLKSWFPKNIDAVGIIKFDAIAFKNNPSLLFFFYYWKTSWNDVTISRRGFSDM